MLVELRRSQFRRSQAVVPEVPTDVHAKVALRNVAFRAWCVAVLAHRPLVQTLDSGVYQSLQHGPLTQIHASSEKIRQVVGLAERDSSAKSADVVAVQIQMYVAAVAELCGTRLTEEVFRRPVGEEIFEHERSPPSGHELVVGEKLAGKPLFRNEFEVLLKGQPALDAQGSEMVEETLGEQQRTERSENLLGDPHGAPGPFERNEFEVERGYADQDGG